MEPCLDKKRNALKCKKNGWLGSVTDFMKSYETFS